MAGDFQHWAGRSVHSDSTLRVMLRHVKPYFAAYLTHLHPGRVSRDPLAELTDAELAGFPAFFAERWKDHPFSSRNIALLKGNLRHVLQGRLPARLLEPITGFRARLRPASKGSALREKNPTRERIEEVTAWLEARGTSICRLAAAWLRAARVAGLRPKEWRDAVWADDPQGGVLAVPNGKQNAFFAQGTGRWRHLLFPGDENADTRRVLKTFLELLHEEMARFMRERCITREEAYTRVQRAVTDALARANKSLRGGRPPSLEEKNICLYSGRNAFKADCRHLAGESGAARRSIAALMGHGSIDSQEYYAPGNVSTGREGMPLALDCEKARVRGARGQTGGGRPASPDSGRTPGPRRPGPRP